MMTRRKGSVFWVIPLLAAGATLCILELTNHYFPHLAWLGGGAILVAIVIRLMILGRREP
jgi:hypothetical protein